MEVASEPIAVIGLSCRLPQAANTAAFWRLLRDGVDAVGEAPDDRWAGTSLPHRFGGFLDSIEEFDPGFFGISPHEAAAMDPQQRLMLELSWEALEDARIVPGELRDSRTGVFVGVMWNDYAVLADRFGPDDIGQHTMTGSGRAIIANRVSHVLGLRGPSLTVDTAQSSSLVAVHLAGESLRRGESTVAIAGGVNLNILAETTMGAERFGGLSPDGRCYPFDARANGFVRGEGGGAVVLKPLARALADGDDIYCVIAGGAMNNDGDARSLTVPSAVAHRQVISEAFRRSAIEPVDVQYVELHGTGTKVGDPIEAAALGSALGSPVLVGSVKANVGHLEAASGITSVLKVALSIRHRLLPPTLNFETPNPDIPLAALRLSVHTRLTGWPRPDRPLVAGVSSFGMGGTNCHLVLTEPPAPADPGPRCGLAALAWPISGRTPEALRAQAARLLSFVESEPELDGTDVGVSLGATRTAFKHRAVVVGSDPPELLRRLAAFADGSDAAGVVYGQSEPAGKTVFVFPGQGSQWPGMAVELLDSVPVFADSIRACAAAFAPYVDWSLEDVLRDPPDLSRVDMVQPALFAVMVSLAKLWRACGVEPAAVVGHSQGEIAAAYISGALSLADAARVVTLRSQALARLAGRSGMLSVRLHADAVRDRIADLPGVSIAAVNGPTSVAVSGALAALDELLERLTAEGIGARRVAIDYGSHSSFVDEIHEQLLTALSGIEPSSSLMPFYSTVTGDLLDTAGLDAEYWYRNERAPIALERATRALVRDGHTVFVECSPHPLLVPALQETIEDTTDAPAVVVSSLRRNQGGIERLLTSLGELHVRGGGVDWDAGYAGSGARRIGLPTYPFQRARYWLDHTGSRLPEAEPAAIGDPSSASTRCPLWSCATG